MPYPMEEDPIPFATTVTSGTGQFSKATGTLNLSAGGFAENGGGQFVMTGTGTLSGVVTSSPTAYPVPNSPLGAGPQGDSTVLNCTVCSQPVTK